MRRTLLTIATAAISVISAMGAQDIQWEEMVHDYGAINEESGPATCELRFVNRGTSPVSIVTATASCGCTTPDFDKSSVKPGETGVVRVTYDPRGLPGRFSKRVKVETVDDSGDRIKSNLEIRGIVVGSSATLGSRYPVDAGKMRLRNNIAAFGEVKKGQVKTVYIDAYNATADTLHPYMADIPDYIEVKSFEPYVAPAEQMTFVINMKSGMAPTYGIVTDSLNFYSDKGDAPFKLDIIGIVREDFSRMTPDQRAKAPVATITPEVVAVEGLSRGGEPVEVQFEIGNRGKSDLMVRRVYTTDPGVEVVNVPDKVKKGKRGSVTLRIDPHQLPSELLTARIQIITNDPDKPVQTIRVAGEVK